MTLEELKTEANKQGYRLVKKPESIALSRCVCGRRYPEKWYSPDGTFYRCPACDLSGDVGATDIISRKLWNIRVKEKENEKC